MMTAQTQAATILWSSTPYTVNGAGSPAGEFLDTGLFDTSGSQIIAENIGGSATTFDGINFVAHSGTLITGGNSNAIHHSASSPLSNTAHSFFGSTAATVSLSGLTPLGEYRVQVLVMDARNNPAVIGRTVEFDGINQGVYGNHDVTGNSYGNGLLVTGTFTADAATQNFTSEVFSGATSKGWLLNAVVVQSVPEPSTALLGGLGALALLRRRRTV